MSILCNRRREVVVYVLCWRIYATTCLIVFFTTVRSLTFIRSCKGITHALVIITRARSSSTARMAAAWSPLQLCWLQSQHSSVRQLVSAKQSSSPFGCYGWIPVVMYDEIGDGYHHAVTTLVKDDLISFQKSFLPLGFCHCLMSDVMLQCWMPEGKERK